MTKLTASVAMQRRLLEKRLKRKQAKKDLDWKHGTQSPKFKEFEKIAIKEEKLNQKLNKWVK